MSAPDSVSASGDARAYGDGYFDGLDAAVHLPLDHPFLDGLLERLRAAGWAEPGEAAL